MRKIKIILLCLFSFQLLSCTNTSNKNENNTNSETEETIITEDLDSTAYSNIIISVNTDEKVGYFVDGNGTFLFQKQFGHLHYRDLI